MKKYNTFKDYEKEIDDIRAELYKERQELGKEEYDRRKREQFLKLSKKYGWKVVPTQDVRQP